MSDDLKKMGFTDEEIQEFIGLDHTPQKKQRRKKSEPVKAGKNQVWLPWIPVPENAVGQEGINLQETSEVFQDLFGSPDNNNYPDLSPEHNSQAKINSPIVFANDVLLTNIENNIDKIYKSSNILLEEANFIEIKHMYESTSLTPFQELQFIPIMKKMIEINQRLDIEKLIQGIENIEKFKSSAEDVQTLYLKYESLVNKNLPNNLKRRISTIKFGENFNNLLYKAEINNLLSSIVDFENSNKNLAQFKRIVIKYNNLKALDKHKKKFTSVLNQLTKENRVFKSSNKFKDELKVIKSFIIKYRYRYPSEYNDIDNLKIEFEKIKKSSNLNEIKSFGVILLRFISVNKDDPDILNNLRLLLADYNSNIKVINQSESAKSKVIHLTEVPLPKIRQKSQKTSIKSINDSDFFSILKSQYPFQSASIDKIKKRQNVFKGKKQQESTPVKLKNKINDEIKAGIPLAYIGFVKQIADAMKVQELGEEYSNFIAKVDNFQNEQLQKEKEKEVVFVKKDARPLNPFRRNSMIKYIKEYNDSQGIDSSNLSDLTDEQLKEIYSSTAQFIKLRREKIAKGMDTQLVRTLGRIPVKDLEAIAEDRRKNKALQRKELEMPTLDKQKEAYEIAPNIAEKIDNKKKIKKGLNTIVALDQKAKQDEGITKWSQGVESNTRLIYTGRSKAGSYKDKLLTLTDLKNIAKMAKIDNYSGLNKDALGTLLAEKKYVKAEVVGKK